MLELSYSQRLAQSPQAPDDVARLQAIIDTRLRELQSAGPVDRAALALLELSARLDEPSAASTTRALALCEALLATPPAWEQLADPGVWAGEPVMLQLRGLFPGAQALSLWLGYQRALCLTRLQRFDEAQTALAALPQYFPAAASLWLALQTDVPEPERSAVWLKAHPQHLELQLRWCEGLALRDPAAALAACRRAQDLCRRLHGQSQTLERFLQRERQLRREISQASEAGQTGDAGESERLDSSDQSGESDQSACLHVLWEGPLDSHSSLAGINRRWLLRLLADGVRAGHIPFEPPELPPEPGTEALKRVWPQPVDVYVSHRWPPRGQPPVEGKWASIVPWEYGVIPAAWARQLDEELDRIWVPSAFVAQSFAISGVDPARIRVVPNGVDTALLAPDGPRLSLATGKACKFLFVGGLLERKGLDLLLRAYAAAFGAQDDVCLVIKAFGGGSHYATSPLQQQIEALQATPGAPALLLLDDDLSPGQMGELYRACDAYVHPYRGEGFGMPILEAMACGLPVIVPDAGPAPEFCPLDAGWLLPTRIRFEPGRDVAGLGPAIGPPYYTVVDHEALVSALRQAAADPNARRRRGQVAARAALAYDWERIYPTLREDLAALARQAVPRWQRVRRRSERLQAFARGEITPVELAQDLDHDPLLLEALLSQGQSQGQGDARSHWRRALSAGLPLETALAIVTALPELGRPLPLRLGWRPGPGWPRPQSTARIAVLPDALSADAIVGTGSDPALTVRWLTSRPLPDSLAAGGIWYSHPAQRDELLARGIAPGRLAHLPLGADFARFSPEAAATPREDTAGRFVFLALFDWHADGAWQDLLAAYFSAFDETDPVSLVIKPVTDRGPDTHGRQSAPHGEAQDEAQAFEAMVDELMSWMDSAGYDPEAVPALSFVQEDLGHDGLPGLYRSADCFVGAHAVSGIWHLLAQACGLPVISCGHFPFLERPFSEPFRPGDIERLAWLLRAHYAEPEPGRGRIVRDYLMPIHDLGPWQRSLEDRLLRDCLAV